MIIRRCALALLPLLMAGLLAATPAAAATDSAAAPSPARQGVLLDRIVAVVNDDVILLSELQQQTEMVRERLARQGTAVPPGDVLRHQVLEHMITTQLQLQVAKQQGIQVSDDTLNQTLERIAQQNGFTLSEMPARLQAQGISYNQFRDDVRTQLIEQQVRQHSVVERIVVTPAEIDQYLAQQAQQGHGNTQYHLLHILIATPPNATPDQVEKARRHAEEVDQKLKNGADFAATAVAVSNGRQALSGGDLGWLRGSELPTGLASTVLSMKEGQVSDPIKDSSGYHIVKLAGKRSEHHVVVTQTHARHILIKTNLLVNDEEARQRLEKIRQQIENGADFAALARKYSDDPGSAAQGGDLGWVDPGTMVPQFEKAMDALQPKQISQPFQSQFGWHIVQVLGRRKQDQTDKTRREKAYEAIQTRKLRDQTELWLRKLRDQAYVRIRLDDAGNGDASGS